MTVPILTIFSNRVDASLISLVYHLAWMYADLDYTVLAVDLDPQLNLTSDFGGEEWRWHSDGIEQLEDDVQARTIYDAIRPLMERSGDIRAAVSVEIAPHLHVIAGKLAMSSYEDVFAQNWLECLRPNEQALRVITAFWRAIQRAAAVIAADVVLIDLAPNLGAINRAALIASDHILTPVSADRVSLQSLETVGTALNSWRDGWTQRIAANPGTELSLPTSTMHPGGYIVLQHPVRLDRPTRAYEHWLRQIPQSYATAILRGSTNATAPIDDPNCLGVIKRHDSLISLSQEANKPIFHLKASDGAVGSHAKAVLAARSDYELLARRIAAATWASDKSG